MNHRSLLVTLLAALGVFSACSDLQSGERSSAGLAAEPADSEAWTSDGGVIGPVNPDASLDPNHHRFAESLAPIEACITIAAGEPAGRPLHTVSCRLEASRFVGQSGPADFSLVHADDWRQSLTVVWNDGRGATEAQVIVESWPNINGGEELTVARAESFPGAVPRFVVEFDRVGEAYACDRPIGWVYEQRLVVACERREGDRLRCTAPIPKHAEEIEQRFSEDGVLLEERVLQRFSLQIDYANPVITLRSDRGELPTPWRHRLGARSVGELSGDVRW